MTDEPNGFERTPEAHRHTGTVRSGLDPIVTAVLGQDDPLRAGVLHSGLKMPAPPVLTMKEADAAILRRNLRRRMKALGFTARAASLKAGLNSEAVRQILIGRAGSPHQPTLQKLARVLMCTPADLTGEHWADHWPEARVQNLRMEVAKRFVEAELLRASADDAAPAVKEQSLAIAEQLDFEGGPYEWRGASNSDRTARIDTAADQPGARHPALPVHTPAPTAQVAPVNFAPLRDLPIYASAQGGEDGAVILDFTPIDHISRPVTLAASTDAFGFYVVEDSMSPVYEHGDIVVVKPGLPPRSGANAVFIRQTKDGATYALVKRLESWTNKEWRVTQYHPKKKTFTLARNVWSKCLIIVLKQERG